MREDILMYMRDGRPPEAISKLVGLTKDYVDNIIKEFRSQGIDYPRRRLHEKELDPGLGEASALFRRRCSAFIDRWLRECKVYMGQASRATGMTRVQLKRAGAQSPIGQHDFRLSELERLAKAQSKDFTSFMLECLLSDTDYTKVVACLSKTTSLPTSP